MKRVTFKELKGFDHESFNYQYRNLIHVGINWGCEDEMMSTLSFIDDLQTLIDYLKEDMAEEPDGCHLCKEKDERIKNLKEHIEILKKQTGTQNPTEKEKKLIDENLDLHRENYELREKLIAQLKETTGNKSEPAKKEVSK
ncbi:MAG: hypothetical protein ACQERU_09325 [Bacteroidota bacterium]